MGQLLKQLLRQLAADNAAMLLDIDGFQPQSVTTIDPQGGLAIDTDTLCTPDLSFPEWRNGLAGGSTLSALRGQFTLDSYLDAVWLNAQQDVSGDVPKTYVFTPPPGTTSLTFVVPMRMPTATGTKTVNLKVWNGAGSTILQTQAQTVTATAINRTAMTITGLTPGTLYQLAIHCNDSSQNANPYVGRIALVPVGATGVFASSFRRLRVSSSMVAGNILTGWNNGLYPYVSPNADIIFNTNARMVAVETYASSGAGSISALYGGQPLYTGTSITSGNYGFDSVPLPYADEPTNVTIRTGTGLGSIGGVLGKYSGGFVRSIYVPAAYSVTFTPFNTRDLCIGVGDSLILGNSSGDLPFQSWSAHFRQQYAGNFAIDAHNSRQLFTYADTAAKQDAFARFLGKCSPKIIIWDLSVNDFVSHPWSGGATGYLNFAAAQANVIDLIHDRYSPLTKHIVKTACRLTTETDQGNGTMANFRTALTGIATGRASYVLAVDGTSLMAAGDIDVDGVHMTTIGQAKVGSGMIAQAAAIVPPEA